MRKFNILEWISFVLIIVGAVNWGFVGLFGVDIVARIFGDMSPFSRIIYDMVGLAGLYVFYVVVQWHTNKE